MIWCDDKIYLIRSPCECCTTKAITPGYASNQEKKEVKRCRALVPSRETL